MGSRGRWALAGQVLAALVAGTAAVVSACLVFLLLGSIFGDISKDPHGYAAIFGSRLLIPASLAGATALPFAVRREHRRARVLAACGSVVWVVGAFVLPGVTLSS